MKVSKDEELLAKKTAEYISIANSRKQLSFSNFLNLHELHIVHSTAKSVACTSYCIYGGYDMAERQMAVFLPDALYYSSENVKFPISCIHVIPMHEKFAQDLSHRDYLGAVLGLGINRNKTGDIIVDGKSAYIFCHNEMTNYICSNLKKIRNTSVTCEIVESEGIQVKPKIQEIAGTVTSVRLDKIIALAFSSSRSRLQGLIEGEKVYVNGRLITSNSYKLKENDVISVRKLGRIKYIGIIGQSKKEKQRILLHKYI